MRRLSVLGSLLVLVLAACAPQSQPRTTVEELAGTVGYYPSEAGARWEYLPRNAALDDDRSILAIEGPRVVNGEVLTGWRLYGGGLDHRYYRSYRADGVRLHASSYPGASLSFNPPILEYPSAQQLRTGARWSGSSVVTITQPAAPSGQQITTSTVDYTYAVVDRRRVRVTAGEFDVYVINRVTNYRDGSEALRETLTQELWFSPYVGEIQTVTGEFLVALNFMPTVPETRP